MASVTKLSVSVPTDLANELKAQAAQRGIPVSQLLTETTERQASASRFRARLAHVYGPFSDADRGEAQELLESAQTPAEILRAHRAKKRTKQVRIIVV